MTAKHNDSIDSLMWHKRRLGVAHWLTGRQTWHCREMSSRHCDGMAVAGLDYKHGLLCFN